MVTQHTAHGRDAQWSKCNSHEYGDLICV